MGKNDTTFRELSKTEKDDILILAGKLNPNQSKEELNEYLIEMFKFDHYHCFGLYQHNRLIGISSGWITVRFYSGKQLELDNVIIDNEIRSTGLGRRFLELIEGWAKANFCKTLELNTYVRNDRSHKFYFNLGYSILGFHFQKHI